MWLYNHFIWLENYTLTVEFFQNKSFWATFLSQRLRSTHSFQTRICIFSEKNYYSPPTSAPCAGNRIDTNTSNNNGEAADTLCDILDHAVSSSGSLVSRTRHDGRYTSSNSSIRWFPIFLMIPTMLFHGLAGGEVIFVVYFETSRL